ncbi:MAG: deoxyribose-phosphate aldolase [Treponema sp.]|nr:deoxyribose-phosphate aldolase [Treponema sp.]
MENEKKAKEKTTAELAAYIDHSVLKPDFTETEIRKYIKEGIDFGCKTVCVNPSSLPIIRELCKDTKTGICAVCDFPFGLSSTMSKIKQIEDICRQRDIEDLDIVANYGWIKSGLWKETKEQFKAVTDACHQYGSIIKIIFETDALTLDEVLKATEIACSVGVDFVKTSTGFYTGDSNNGATVEVIKVMLDNAKGNTKVKASGGIRDRDKFFNFIDMGVKRIGIGCKSTPVVLGL